MAHELLIDYLHKQKEACEAKINGYAQAVAEKDLAEQNYNAACKKVEELGDLTTLVAERDAIAGYINELEIPVTDFAAEPTIEQETPLSDATEDNVVGTATAIDNL